MFVEVPCARAPPFVPMLPRFALWVPAYVPGGVELLYPSTEALPAMVKAGVPHVLP